MTRQLNRSVYGALVAMLFFARPAAGATSRQIQDAIDQGRVYLYSQLNEWGTWETAPQATAVKEGYETTGGQWGGLTALATYSLLAAGDGAREARLGRARRFLETADLRGIYAVGLRAQIWPYLPLTPQVRQAISRDGKLLIAGLKTEGAARGMYGYLSSNKIFDVRHPYDHSVSQYGVLGMWALQESGLEVSDQYWAAVDSAWRRDQLSDGGWSYYSRIQGGYPETISMTAAGVASLFASDDYLRASAGLRCSDNLADHDIDRGLAWIGNHFASLFDAPNRACYALYGIERIGVAAGRKNFGDTDWYQKGADFLLDHQLPGGGWDQGDGAVADTAFALLFLTRGRAPVVMNKLDYSSAANGAWNHRPRDAAHLAGWISKTLEAHRPLNWQVVSLGGAADDWHDAPILYVCGREALKFSVEQQGKLKRFIEDGGLIVFNADCASSAPFVNSVKAMGQAMFGSDFRELPQGHVIYADEEFHRKQWHNAPSVLGLSNGARELMVLIPSSDLSAAWQVNSPLVRPEAFELAADIFLYAVDKENLRFKGESYLVKTDANVTAATKLKIARLKYAAGTMDWNPEPGGWRRLGAVMHNRDSVDLDIHEVEPGDGSLVGGGYKIAHVTGVSPLIFSAAARDEIRRFVEGGGTLIVDAAGGSRRFADSARMELTEIFGDKAAQLDKPLAIENPLYAAGNPRLVRRDIQYRPFARTVLSDVKEPRMCGIDFGGRIGVYFSGEDLSVGLVGQPVDGIVGYTPDLATRLMERMILATETK